MSMSGPVVWNDSHEQARRPFRLRGMPLTPRLRVREARKRLRSAERRQLRAASCVHHEPTVALKDEHGRHIGYLCWDCLTIFTRTGAVSTATLPRLPHVPEGEHRSSKAHAARIRAVDRLGAAYDARRAA